MIITELYNGQGFGNQLFVYATLRSIAEQNGFFGVFNVQKDLRVMTL